MHKAPVHMSPILKLEELHSNFQYVRRIDFILRKIKFMGPTYATEEEGR